MKSKFCTVFFVVFSLIFICTATTVSAKPNDFYNNQTKYQASAQPQATTVSGIPAAGTTMQTPRQPKSFGRAMGDGFVNAGKYTWKGIKKVGQWTWSGCKYVGKGSVSLVEAVGLKRKPGELEAHQDILEVANRTLVESSTKRQIRERSADSNTSARKVKREVVRQKVVR